MLLFTGCEFQLTGDFFNEVSEPSASHAGEITLSIESDSIYISEQTAINYSVNSFGLNCNAVEIKYLNNSFVNTETASGSLLMVPDFNNTEWFDLTANFYLGTGSGSIADKFKMENYIGSKTWKIKFVDYKTFNFKLQYHVNKDSILEVFWVKPKYFGNIKNTLWHYSRVMNPTRISGDTLFYSDPNYCGGSEDYRLYINEDRNVTVTVNFPYPVLTVSSAGLDSCQLSWDESPIKRFYKVGKYEGFKCSVKEQIYLGESRYYTLKVYPPNYQNDAYPYSTVQLFYCQEKKAQYALCYSGKRDVFYLSKSSEIPGISISGVPLPIYDNIEGGYGSSYNISCNNAGTIVICEMGGIVRVFDQHAALKKTITIGNQFRDYYLHDIAEDGSFGCFPDNKNYVIYNLGADPTWEKFTFQPLLNSNINIHYTFGLKMTTDGKYVACCGEFDFYLYDVSDHTTAKIVSTAPHSEVQTMLPNPLNASEILVTCQNKLEIRSCPEFQVTRSMQIDGITKLLLTNIDTYSGLLMSYSLNYYHIIDINSMKEVLRLKKQPSSNGALLYRNHFCRSGVLFDLTPYLK